MCPCPSPPRASARQSLAPAFQALWILVCNSQVPFKPSPPLHFLSSFFFSFLSFSSLFFGSSFIYFSSIFFSFCSFIFSVYACVDPLFYLLLHVSPLPQLSSQPFVNCLVHLQASPPSALRLWCSLGCPLFLFVSLISSPLSLPV